MNDNEKFNPLADFQPTAYIPDEYLGGGEESREPTWFQEKDGILKGRDYRLVTEPVIMKKGWLEGMVGAVPIQISPEKADTLGIDLLQHLKI